MRFLVVLIAATLGACARPPVPPQGSMAEYKRYVAFRIVEENPGTYSEPMPDVMKSIVVLAITVDDRGQATDVAVLRSNGYEELEKRALASVAKAAPFAPPASGLLQGAPSVTFLETFLFREDGFFQVRSLVPDEKLF